MPVILVTQEAEIRRIAVLSQPGQTDHETLSQKYLTQKGLMEWLKVYTLSSSPSTGSKEGGREASKKGRQREREREICRPICLIT
jgi:hypothetical protein